ncbi:WXG100 family type VII secretion target [Saccharothrix australiensis]|uniref:Type VII secretion system (Wss) protein ESAT-6 n=1 Tax=Saccharothrix australiensis TaxID=2072 RepID=A0A495W1V5_9PSEU|nr:WXG100 family type VII secretion target [Saccharothrix australiensis]RKT55671.1 type VII secretion system (Wss) protein ESAT-6 [Saccharothrix australiensis]
MAGLNGYEIYRMVSEAEGADGLNQAADVAKDARTRIQNLGDELRRLTAELEAAWQGKASERAARAAQPIEQGLQTAQETLEKVDTSLRTQAQSCDQFKNQVMPVATPEPPELTLFDEITPWDTDNEIARKQWFEADAHNRRVYADYAAATEQNQAVLPQMAPASGGGGAGADTAVQTASASTVQSATSAPPRAAGEGGATAPSSAGSAGGGKASAPPSTGSGGDQSSGTSPSGSAGGGHASAPPSLRGGGRTSVSNKGDLAGRAPAAHVPAPPRLPGERTAIADLSTGAPGGVPIAARPASARDTARTSSVPKGDHLAGGAPMLPGGMGVGDPTGTRGQRGTRGSGDRSATLGAGDRSAVLGRTPTDAVPAAPGARGATGRAAMAGMGGMGGFVPHAPYARADEDEQHQRTVYLKDDSDALVGPMPDSVAPVIGED